MTKFMVKLKAIGYNRNQRWEILKSGSRRYNRMVEEEKKGIRRVNRPRWEKGDKRYIGKLLKKKNWFKKKRETTDEERGNCREGAKGSIDKERGKEIERGKGEVNGRSRWKEGSKGGFARSPRTFESEYWLERSTCFFCLRF